MNSTWRRYLGWSLAALIVLGGVATWSVRSVACPFCAAVSLTFSEEIDNSQVAVVAELLSLPPRDESDDAGAGSLEVPKAKFKITRILKGSDALGDERKIDTVYFGDAEVGSKFLIMGIDPPMISWSTPIAITDRAEEYIVKAIELPKDDADRLAFFQDYLEDEDEMLARDAYDEFAKTPYAGVVALKDRMKHDQLIAWIKSPKIPVSRRRLYLTMLGVCGGKDDVPTLEQLIKSQDRQTRGALDALVAAFLTLKGPEGMPLVEELFLENKDAEYTDTYATIMALRFHGTEENIIPRERLLEGIRLMLDRPQLADLVIPDLARWEDWSVMDRLVELFKTADDESSWVRVPVINYLRACPKPEAKERLDELAKIDPETVKRANSFFPFAAGGATPVKADADKDATAKNDPAGEKPKTEAAAETAPTAPTQKAEADKKDSDDKPADTSGAAAPPAGDKKPRETAGLSRSFAKDAAASVAPQANNLSVFAGLAAVAALLGCAFWAILKGGQRVAS